MSAPAPRAAKTRVVLTPGMPGLVDPRRMRRTVLVFSAAALVIALAIAAVKFTRAIDDRERELRFAAKRLAAELTHDIQLRVYAIELAAAQAEDTLAGRSRPGVDAVSLLRAVPERQGFTLELPPGADPAQFGNLTGGGDIPAPGSPAAVEMDMALSLSRQFAMLRERDPSVPWMYYVSRRDFVYLVPRVGVDAYFWEPELTGAHFRYRGETLDYPVRRLYWSPVYADTAGKGPMFTVSKTVVHGDQLVGSVSADFTIETLRELIARYPVPSSTVRLLDEQGVVVLGPDAPPVLPAGEARPTQPPPARRGPAGLLLPLEPAGWHLQVVTPRSALLLHALRDSAVYGVLVLLLLGGVVLLTALSRTLGVLAVLSVHDALTGVYNRRHFDDMARIELSRARRSGSMLGLLLIDVDHFKGYNDAHGHRAGDQALRTVADTLRSGLRRAGDLLFRVGGEEFAALVVVDRTEQLEQLSIRLRDSVRELEIANAGSPRKVLTVSVGGTLVDPRRVTDVDAAYEQADRALYRAKDQGRDRAIVE